MPVLQILVLLFFMVLVPLALGAGVSAFIREMERNICFMWVAGYLIMFAVFQIICVPMIMKFCLLTSLVWVFGIICVILAMVGGGIWFVKVSRTVSLRVVGKKERNKAGLVLWAVFGILLLIQLVAAIFMVCGDGDDAFYVAAATVADGSDKMYLYLPYVGGTTKLDYRHVLAPLPMFIAFLSRVTGFHTAALAHTGMQVFLIPVTYGIYGLIGDRLFKGKKNAVAIFMIFVAIVIMWGNVSVYTSETFLLTRTRQGKASLANLAIPALVLLMYMVGERLAEKKKVEKALWVMVFAAITAACLCSSFGGFLMALLLGGIGLCMIVTYKRWSLIVPLFISVIPAAVYSLMYVVLG